MNLCYMVLFAVCLREVVSAKTRSSRIVRHSSHRTSTTAVLHITLIHLAAICERALPLVGVLAPSNTPLIAGLWKGCNALSIRIPMISHLTQTGSLPAALCDTSNLL